MCQLWALHVGTKRQFFLHLFTLTTKKIIAYHLKNLAAPVGFEPETLAVPKQLITRHTVEQTIRLL